MATPSGGQTCSYLVVTSFKSGKKKRYVNYMKIIIITNNKESSILLLLQMILTKYSSSFPTFVCAVSKLREHWEETASAVTARRNQLEELLTDSHQFERRKQDVDQWLGRMENRLSKLAPVAGTADLIDTQHREQKVLLLLPRDCFIIYLINNLT
jgi:hypothetical protein